MIIDENEEIDVKDLGYESAHEVLSTTVEKGRGVEKYLEEILKELGYKENETFLKQKKPLSRKSLTNP